MAKGSAIDCQNIFFVLHIRFQNRRNVYSLQGDRKLPVAIRNEMFRAEFSVKEYWQLCYLVVRSRCVDLITSLLILAFLGWSFHLKTISVCINDCYGENLCIKKKSNYFEYELMHKNNSAGGGIQQTKKGRTILSS